MVRRTLLAISAHHDDCEYAAGGLMLQAAARGWRVVSVTLAGDHDSWEATAGRPDAVRRELLQIAREMKVEKRFYSWSYHQVLHQEEFVRPLMELAEELKPRLALIHWPHDHWTDHEAAGQISKHALWFPSKAWGGAAGRERKPRLLFFETGPNQSDGAVPFRPDTYVDITREMDQVARIVHRLDEVVHGRRLKGQTGHEEDKRARARLRGAECGVRYAEAFVALPKATQNLLSAGA